MVGKIAGGATVDEAVGMAVAEITVVVMATDVAVGATVVGATVVEVIAMGAVMVANVLRFEATLEVTVAEAVVGKNAGSKGDGVCSSLKFWL
jgi:hypothetical protein